MFNFSRMGLAVLLLFVAGCGGASDTSDDGMTRTERPDGVVEISYTALPADRVVTASVDLEIGAEDRGDAYIFGDIRDIDPASDGTIYVFDYQASEIRAFDSSGRYLRTVASSGEGPGEITEANGMSLVGDTILWVHDYRRSRMSGIGTHGGERAIYEIPIRSYGAFWRGVIDESGRYIKGFTRSDAPFPPTEGIVERGYESYMLRYDPETEERDSVYVGRGASKSYILPITNGFRFYSVPFQTGTPTVIDPAGGFWKLNTSEYGLARLDADGDTTLVVRVHMEPLPVTDEDRDEVLSRAREGDADALNALQEVVATLPDVKPLIDGYILDDRRRLWVQRTVANGERPVYDVFGLDGEFVASVRLDFEVTDYFPIRVRDGRIYALGESEVGAPVVLRTAPVDLSGVGDAGDKAS
jgi:hypothetical protein